MALPDLSRRAFLGLAGGAVVLAACGGSDDSSGGGDDDGTDAADGSTLQGLRLSSDLYVSDQPQRFVFAMTRGNDYYAGPAATIAFLSPSQQVTQPTETTFRADGLPENRGIYVSEPVLDEAGIWAVRIDLENGEKTELPIQVEDTSHAVVVGAAAPRVATPTVADAMGVNPICTRDPDCTLHDVSLDQVVGTGRPVLAMFSTPARCESRYCGPTLDLLLDVMEPFQDRVTPVHIEIYRAETGLDLVPAVEAYGLPGEPWAFGIDGAGTVVGRLDGAFDQGEINDLLSQLAG